MLMNMRFIFAVCGALLCLSQSVARAGDVPMSVAVRSGHGVLDDGSLKILGQKMRAALAGSGIMADGYSGIVVCPSVDVSGKRVVEGGMRSITVFDFLLTVSVMHAGTGAEFGSVSIDLRGEGCSEKEACMSAVRKINPSDKRLADLLKTGSKRVTDYYAKNTNALITMARTKAGMKEYEEALALLAQYPVALPEYGSVAKAMAGIYAKWQADVCGQLVQKAYAAYSTGDCEAAAGLLGEVDMQSPCAEEARRLAADIRSRLDAESAAVLDFMKEQMRTEADIEKQRIKSIENVAKAYYRQRTDYVYVVW